ncbi:MAG: uroporphyrinogen-III C-methyltransferase [Legionellales bacterium]|nr:uroporphyrinogen-III C-methyltransferase [Legionellales bacterium]
MTEQPSIHKETLAEASLTDEKFYRKIPLASYLLIIAIIVILFAVLYPMIRESTTQQTVRSLQTQIAQLQQTVITNQSTNETALKQLSVQAQQFTQNTQTQLNEYTKKIQTLTQDRANKNQSLVLAETLYLVRLANYTLHLTGKISQTILMLENADQRLASLNNPKFLAIRQTLAQDITRLQAVPQVDYVALILKLQALSDQVEKLGLNNPVNDANHASLPVLPATTWREKLKNSLHHIEKLIVIRHHDKPIEPLLPAEQAVYLRQNIQLLLQQAQWAVLQKNQALYQNNLTRVIETIKQYYDINQADARGFLTSIEQLRTTNVQPALPNIDDSLSLLQHLNRTT